MKVEELIEALQDMDPYAEVVIEGSGPTTCWTVRAAGDDDLGSFVLLSRGVQIPMSVVDE
jgi:hypothetical protein